MLPHYLPNFMIRRYCQNQSQYNSVYSRNSLPKTKDRVYTINLDVYK